MTRNLRADQRAVAPEGFSSEIAAKTGKSQRTINRQMAAKPTPKPEPKDIEGHRSRTATTVASRLSGTAFRSFSAGSGSRSVRSSRHVRIAQSSTTVGGPGAWRPHLRHSARSCGGRFPSDVACPICGPSRQEPENRKRKVLRVWLANGFATYNCARCGAHGYAHAKGARRLKAAPGSANRITSSPTVWTLASAISVSLGGTRLPHSKAPSPRSSWSTLAASRRRPTDGRWHCASIQVCRP